MEPWSAGLLRGVAERWRRGAAGEQRARAAQQRHLAARAGTTRRGALASAASRHGRESARARARERHLEAALRRAWNVLEREGGPEPRRAAMRTAGLRGNRGVRPLSLSVAALPPCGEECGTAGSPGSSPEAADDPAVLRWTLTDGPAPAAPAGEPGVLWGREAESTAGFAASAHGFAVNGVAFRRARAQPSCVSAGLKNGSCCCGRHCWVCGAPGCRCAVWQCRHKDLQAAGLARSAVSRSGGCGKEPCDGSAASHMARGFGGTDRESDPRGARLPSQLVGMELNGKAQAIEWQRGVHGLVVLLNVCHQNVRPQLRIYPGGLCVVANVPRAVGGEVGNIKVPGGHSLELSLRR